MRVFSFAQESTRYCNYGNEEHISYILPSWIQLDDSYINRPLSQNLLEELYQLDNDDLLHWITMMLFSETGYMDTIKELKWTPQQARSVLPNSLKTEINMSANLREWRHIFKQRCSPAAHPQMREIMIPLLHEMQAKIPLIFDDIKY